nr:uncharacterized protein LOC127328359 [Lolium perenne]
MKSDEAVRYEKAYCSFQSLATLEPFGHIDNYLILCYCRKLFHDKHPSISRKHFFFPYVGETILRYNGNNGDIVQTAFEGANSAFCLWRSDQMQFPIVIANHWFLFAVCLKAKVFAFCDSLYDEGDPFHITIRQPLIQNFIALWNILVTPHMSYQIDFTEFQTRYPPVPKQDNSDDCGVFTMKFMDIHDPRTQMQNSFSQADIINLRIKFSNQIYFSKFNTLDKTVVSEYFGDYIRLRSRAAEHKG